MSHRSGLRLSSSSYSFVVGFLGGLVAASLAAGQEGERPPAHFQFTKEQQDAHDAAIAKFHDAPTRDDFLKLEEIAKLMRSAKAPNSVGTHWVQWFYASLQNPPKTDADSWKNHFDKLDRWIAAVPDSATPLVVKAGASTNYGWQERGSGFANTVSEARWAVFHDQIEKAEALLEAAREKKNHDAAVYGKLVIVGMAQGAERETIDEYLAAAQKIDPRFYPIYEAIAVDLLPRWGGEPGDVGKFASQMLQENPGGDGLEIYARIAAEVNRYDLTLLLEGEFDPQRVREGMKIVQARYPNSNLLQNFAALVAWRTQDLELARAARKYVTANTERSVWGAEQFHRSYVQFCDLKLPPPKQQRIVWSLQELPVGSAISPSGNSVVVVSQTAKTYPLSIRSVADLSLVEVLPGATNAPSDVAIAPTATWVAVAYVEPAVRGQPGMVDLYRIGNWDSTRRLADERLMMPSTMEFSPDGKLLAVRYGSESLGLWNVESGKLDRVDTIEGGIQGIRFSPDSAQLLITQGGGSLLLETASGKELHRLSANSGGKGPRGSQGLAFLADGKILALGSLDQQGRQSLFRWDYKANQHTLILDRVEGRFAAISPTGKFLVMTRHDQMGRGQALGIDVWMPSERKRLAEWGMASPRHVAFSSNERHLSIVCSDRSVRILDLSQYLPAAAP